MTQRRHHRYLRRAQRFFALPLTSELDALCGENVNWILLRHEGSQSQFTCGDNAKKSTPKLGASKIAQACYFELATSWKTWRYATEPEKVPSRLVAYE